jgi:hypothetical protein
MAIRERRLVQDQSQRFTAAGKAFQNLSGERRHDFVGIDQRIGQKAGDPLIAHVSAVGLQRQRRRQIHQVGAPRVQHRRHQQRQLAALRLALLGKKLLKLSFDTIRKAFDTGHGACPGSTKGGDLEPHTDLPGQQPFMPN